MFYMVRITPEGEDSFYEKIVSATDRQSAHQAACDWAEEYVGKKVDCESKELSEEELIGRMEHEWRLLLRDAFLNRSKKSGQRDFCRKDRKSDPGENRSFYRELLCAEVERMRMLQYASARLDLRCISADALMRAVEALCDAQTEEECEKVIFRFGTQQSRRSG